MEIDRVERFKNAGKLSSYAGLVPSTYSSGDRLIHGKMTKRGNKWIRWAVIEAVWPAIRNDWRLREYYNRLRERKDANLAKVAVAQRILKSVYQILKYKKKYEELWQLTDRLNHPWKKRMSS